MRSPASGADRRELAGDGAGHVLVRYRQGADAPARIGALVDGLITALPYPDMRAAVVAQADGTLEAAGGRETVDASKTELLAPLPDPGKIVGIGLNYRDHAEEIGQPLPPFPVVFAKFANTIAGPNDPIVGGPRAAQVDYEAELGVVIGRRARHVSEARALEHVAGYMNFNDVTARDVQFSGGGGQWTLGKSLDTYAPTGPWLVTADRVRDPQRLSIACTVNGVTVQESNTALMIFSVAELIAFLSAHMTLDPGDLIATGTPAGVGMAHSPPTYLRSGDEVRVEVQGLGRLTNTVR